MKEVDQSTARRHGVFWGFFFPMLLSPEVDVSQEEVDARLRNPDGPVGHHHLVLLHGARQPRLPSDHENACAHVHTFSMTEIRHKNSAVILAAKAKLTQVMLKCGKGKIMCDKYVLLCITCMDNN